MADPSFIPYARQWIEDDDVAAVVAVLRGDYLTTGPAIARFEEEFARRAGARFAVACANGTAALHLALLALEAGPADTLITSAITFLASANCGLYVGADVRFADLEPETRCLAPDDVARVAAEITAAGRPGRTIIIPVHLAGLPARTAEIARRCPGAIIIEDAAHALGAQDEDGPVGACRHSRAAIFSFHPVKHITTGEGGAITTNDEELYRRLSELRSHGMTRDPAAFTNRELAFDETGEPNPWYYEMARLGYNYRLTDLGAALGSSQLGKLERFLARRRAIVARYQEAFAGLPALEPPAERPGARSAWHLYTPLFDFRRIGKSRARVMRELRDKGIGTQVHYIPVPRQPVYRRLREYDPRRFPQAERYYERCLSLPLYPAMTDAEVDRVIAAVREVVRD